MAAAVCCAAMARAAAAAAFAALRVGREREGKKRGSNQGRKYASHG
jgi:hypothetical protein